MSEKSHDSHPYEVLAAKQAMMLTECEKRHRALERDRQEWRVMMYGEKGDNGMKSMVVRLGENVRQLTCEVKKLNERTNSLDGRVWKLLMAVGGLSAAIGGGAGSLFNHLVK